MATLPLLEKRGAEDAQVLIEADGQTYVISADCRQQAVTQCFQSLGNFPLTGALLDVANGIAANFALEHLRQNNTAKIDVAWIDDFSLATNESFVNRFSLFSDPFELDLELSGKAGGGRTGGIRFGGGEVRNSSSDRHHLLQIAFFNCFVVCLALRWFI